MRAARLALVVLLGLASSARADDDHEAARRAVERGEIRPLGALLEALGGELAGDVIEVELERKRGRLVYEIKTLDRRGRVGKVEIDAATGEVLRRRGE